MTTSAQVRSHTQAGFTLTEVMIAAAMTTAVLAAGFGALTISQKTTRVTGQVGNTQATARNGLDMITADLKLAGFGMQGLPAPVGGCHINGMPSALVPGDNNSAGADFGPDTISMVVPMTNSIAAVGPLWQVFVPPAGTIGGTNSSIANIPMALNATTGMGDAIPGGMPALIGMAVSLGGVAGSFIQSTNSGGVVVSPAIPGPTAFGTGTQVYLIQCITYEVIPPPDALGICQGAAPCLVRGAVPAALVGPGGAPRCNQINANCTPIMDGVEDLQVAYACDGCNPLINSGNPDGQIDDLDGSGGFNQGDFITNRNWFSTDAPFGVAMTPGDIRLAQVTIVARQTQADQGLGEGNGTAGNQSSILVVSDHNHATGLFTLGDNTTPAQQQAYAQFRRRVFTRTVELRNLRS